MKKLKVVLGSLFVALLVSCSDDPSNVVKNEVIDAISNGTWRISYFYDADVDKSSTYTEYIFTFRDSDVVTAEESPTTTQQMGLWRISDSNDNEDVLEDLLLNITFNAPPEFELLSNDWKITEYSLTVIKLTDVNDTGGNDYLTLEKIQ